MLNTLYKKLAALLFLLLTAVGACLIWLYIYTAEMYEQEVSQRLNATLAGHIVSDSLPIKNGAVDQSALDSIFHMLMIINPGIEVYLLDAGGKILAYSAPPEKIKRDSVDLKPIIQFLASGAKPLIKGSDPRHLSRQKIFSAAPIPAEGPREGYLYVILGGEAYDSTADMIQGSYFLKIGLTGLSVALVIALLAGLWLLSLVTRRVGKLSAIMHNFLSDAKSADFVMRYPAPEHPRDEIDALGRTFNIMADKIDTQLAELKSNDTKRRELIANVSHDLRTPLTSLQGYLETLMLKQDTLSDEEKQKYLQIVTGHSQRLGQLVTELFELAKLDSVETLLHIEPFSMGELVQDVVQKYQLTAVNKGIQLKSNFGEDLPSAYGDIGLIQRVLENLIDNAIRYTSAGGSITVDLTSNKDNIAVKIIDTGCGIEKEELPHIFDRFYRSKREDKERSYNSGLGLAITKRILSLHGSDIAADSDVDQGTTFTFELPAQTI
ncbi:MAG: HAMP domain-containing histidine kinase [Gammaproteobacteria bacterium]|nr:HAMP domain-containing histidine kinase [Gammaproteobacteria bacterium]